MIVIAHIIVKNVWIIYIIRIMLPMGHLIENMTVLIWRIFIHANILVDTLQK